MKRFALLLVMASAMIGCAKNEVFNIGRYWWGNNTLYGAKEINIRFIGDTEFEFESEDYLNGRGRYQRNGDSVTFDFETYAIEGFGRSCIKLISGQWNTYPTSDLDVFRTSLDVIYEKWFDAGSNITTEKKLNEAKLSISRRDN